MRRGDTKSCGCLKNKPSWRWKGYEEISGAYWYGIKDGAKRRNLSFDLSIVDAWKQYEQQEGKCAISGEPIMFVRQKKAGEQTASLDRKCSKAGYSKTNIQWVHKKINSMKLGMSDSEFVEWCKKVARNSDEQFGY